MPSEVASRNDVHVRGVSYKRARVPPYRLQHLRTAATSLFLLSKSTLLANALGTLTLEMTLESDPLILDIYQTPAGKTDFDGKGAYAECVQLYGFLLHVVGWTDGPQLNFGACT